MMGLKEKIQALSADYHAEVVANRRHLHAHPELSFHEYETSKFIQSSGTSVEEGYIYIDNDKIRLDYFNPDRTLKISRDKGVYINHELREEEFFSTKELLIKVFYDVFLDENFFS